MLKHDLDFQQSISDERETRRMSGRLSLPDGAPKDETGFGWLGVHAALWPIIHSPLSIYRY